MSFYECVFIVRQDVPATQVEALTNGFVETLTGLQGKVAKVEPWGLRPLAYPIKKNKTGHYVLLNVDAPAAAVAELERQMRLHEDVLRFLTVKVDELEAGPSVVVRREEREERNDRGGSFGGDRGGRSTFRRPPSPVASTPESSGEQA